MKIIFRPIYSLDIQFSNGLNKRPWFRSIVERKKSQNNTPEFESKSAPIMTQFPLQENRAKVYRVLWIVMYVECYVYSGYSVGCMEAVLHLH